MNLRKEQLYLVGVELIYIVGIFSYSILKKSYILSLEEFYQVPCIFLLMCLLLALQLGKRQKKRVLGVLFLLNSLFIWKWGDLYFFFMPIILLEFLIEMDWPLLWSSSLLLILPWVEEPLGYFLAILFFGIIYYQHTILFASHRKVMDQLLHNEGNLQRNLEKETLRHKQEIQSFTLTYENERLEEKRQLSQNLHDKLGHSINGSIFQLEACKLLLYKKPEETEEKLQSVITNLRESMDEIRWLLRKEKPSSGEMNLLKLKSFCNSFQEKYELPVCFSCEGSGEGIQEEVWLLLLDSFIEAFSNTLKYAQCSQIQVTLFIYPRFLRCSIKDDGKGCRQLKEGMGISGIKERVRRLGGSVDITSHLGFEIQLYLPLGEGEKDGTHTTDYCG